MTIADNRFYVTGGSLPSDNPSYVERKADHELHDALRRREFCYVLTARQMGKSSLMVRTAARLREEGVAVAVLDLTAIGQNVDAEQWYYSLLGRLGEQIGLEAELDKFWLKQERLGPLRRFMAALQHVAVPALQGGMGGSTGSVGSVGSADRSGTPHTPHTPHTARQLVLFIDEIDAVRSLPFPTDEFFAAIRECFNRRAEDPAYQQLTFCLLGVAAPTDLIRDTRMTPFNIGRRIELSDFTEAEAAPLAAGLEVGEMGAPGRPRGLARALLQRILHWTGGHPYLTQRLCQAVAAAPSPGPSPHVGGGVTEGRGGGGRALVDRLCESLFLASRAQEKDDNLIFVRERLLRSEEDRAALLELYGRIWQGKRVPYDETDPLCTLLRLSGIVRLDEGKRKQEKGKRAGAFPSYLLPFAITRFAGTRLLPSGASLRVRNRIYARVFDRGWVAARMPDAELRRQHAAYRRGLARASMLSGVVVALIAALAWTALRSAAATKRLADDRRQALIQSRSERDRFGDLLYTSQMNLAHLAYKDGKIVRARRLLEQHRPLPGEPDRREFVWRYLWRLCRSQDRYTFPARAGEVNSVAISPDGRLLAAGGADGAVQLWDTAGKSLLATVPAHRGASGVTFSPDGRLLATAGWEDGTVKLWDLGSRPTSPRTSGGLGTPALRRQFKGLKRVRARALFTPDGKTLVAGSGDDTIRLWDLASTEQTPPAGRSISIRVAGPMALSPDGRTLAVCMAGQDAGRITLWNIAARNVTRLPVSLPPVAGPAEGVVFAPDGRTLVTGAAGRLIRWDTATGRMLGVLAGHEAVILTLAFSPDGKLLGSGAFDGAIRLWDPPSGRLLATLQGHTGSVTSVAFSPRGETLASTSADGTTRLWDTDVRRLREAARERSEAEILARGGDGPGAAAFSPDGKLLAEMSSGAVTLRSVSTNARVGPPLSREPGSGYERHPRRRGCAFSPDGKLLAIGSADGTVRLWDVAARRLIGTLQGNPATVTHLGFAAGGALVTGNGRGGTGAAASVRLWDVASRRLRAVLPGAAFVPHGPLALSPDGRIVATGSPDHHVTLWDIPLSGARPRKVATLEGVVQVTALAFSPDGKLLAAGDREGSIHLWNWGSGRRTRRLVGHVGPVDSLAFSPDSQTLASGGMDRTVRLWNPEVDQEEATLTGHRHWVWSLAFSPDGNTLATGSPDGTVRLWRAAPFAETDAPPGASGPRTPRETVP